MTAEALVHVEGPAEAYRQVVEEVLGERWTLNYMVNLLQALMTALQGAGFTQTCEWGGISAGLEDEGDKRFLEVSGQVRDGASGTLLAVVASLRAATSGLSFGWAMSEIIIQRFDTYMSETLLPEDDRSPNLARRGVFLCQPVTVVADPERRHAQLLERLQAAAQAPSATDHGRQMGFLVSRLEREFAL